jgi:hypothetical protein
MRKKGPQKVRDYIKDSSLLIRTRVAKILDWSQATKPLYIYMPMKKLPNK